MSDIDSASLKVGNELEGAATHIAQSVDSIATELEKLMGQLDPIAETWTGAAAQYYGPLQEEWNMAAAGLFGSDGVLGEIARVMGVAWNNYSDAEWTNVQTWQGAGGTGTSAGGSGS